MYGAAHEAVDLLKLGDAYVGYRIAPLVACLRGGCPEDDMVEVLHGMEPIDLAQVATEALAWIAAVPFAPDKPS